MINGLQSDVNGQLDQVAEVSLPSAKELERKIALFLRQFCIEFLAHYKEAEKAWIARELRKPHSQYRDRIPKPGDFERWIKQRTTTDFPQTVRNWERYFQNNHSSEGGESFSFSIAKVWQVSELLRSSGLTKRDLSSFFKGELENVQGLLDVALELTAIPEDYLPGVKEALKQQVELQVLHIFGEFWGRLEEFRSVIEKTVRGEKEEKRKRLNDLISILFTWYVTTFSKDRAIILIKSRYWNGVHRRMSFNRSRTTKEFVSQTPDWEHQVDTLWFLKEIEVDIQESKLSKLRKTPRNKELKAILEQEKFRSVDIDSLKKSAASLFESVKDRISEDTFSNDSISLAEDIGYSVIQEVLEQFSLRSNWAKSQDWNSDRPSLAYHVIKTGQPDAEDRFSLNKFLAAHLNEQERNGGTDQSGYAIPLYSFDRRSIIGALMVVSSDISAFTKDKLNSMKDQTRSSELAIVREIAYLTERCLDEINRTSLLAYNFTRLLDPSKDFPEIVFDIWMTNLIYSKNIEEDPDEVLAKACRFYQEQQATYGIKNHNATEQMNSVFEIALGDYASSIDVRFGAAVELCLKQIEHSQPTLRDLFDARAKIESECMLLAQQSVGKPGVDVRYLQRLVEQAKGIHHLIEFLENVLFCSPPLTERDYRATVEHHLNWLRFLYSCDVAKRLYREMIIDTIETFLNAATSEQAQINLKKLIYRLHVHFHVTLAMLSNMELTPYGVLFLILASSAYIGASIFSASYSPPEQLSTERELIQQSFREHQELLDEIDKLFRAESQGLDKLIEQHINRVKVRIQEQHPAALDRNLPSYI